MAILNQWGVEPADPCGSRDGVQAQGPDTAGVVAVDGVTHRVVVVVVIVEPAQAGSDRNCATSASDSCWTDI